MTTETILEDAVRKMLDQRAESLITQITDWREQDRAYLIEGRFDSLCTSLRAVIGLLEQIGRDLPTENLIQNVSDITDRLRHQTIEKYQAQVSASQAGV